MFKLVVGVMKRFIVAYSRGRVENFSFAPILLFVPRQLKLIIPDGLLLQPGEYSLENTYRRWSRK